MKIRIHNDGKERDFSFEADIADLWVETMFGESEEEVISMLKNEVQKLIKDLNELDYTNVEYVDYIGKIIQPIKKHS